MPPNFPLHPDKYKLAPLLRAEDMIEFRRKHGNLGAVAVPRSAVTTFAGVTKLFVVEEGVAREREVVLGVDLGDGWVEIAQGVSRGQQVVTSGLSKLADGTEVTVRADAAPGA